MDEEQFLFLGSLNKRERKKKEITPIEKKENVDRHDEERSVQTYRYRICFRSKRCLSS